jgi:predicted amidohydrolase
MRLLLTAMVCPKGELEANFAAHLDLLRRGHESGCDLVLLPEMSLTGYRPGAAISLAHHCVRSLVDATGSGGAAICFGIAEQTAGKPFITQVVAAHGEIVVLHRKAHLPDDELGDFQPGHGSGRFHLGANTFSIAVCAEIGTAPPYRLGSDIVLAPAAPGLYGARRRTEEDWRRGYDWWHGSVIGDARRLLDGPQWLALSTQAGATDDEDFPGWAALIGPGGEVAVSLPDWREGTLIAEVSP